MMLHALRVRVFVSLVFTGLTVLVLWSGGQPIVDAKAVSEPLSIKSWSAFPAKTLPVDNQIYKAESRRADSLFNTMAPLTTPTPLACGLAWRIVSSPNPSFSNNPLGDVVAVSADDIWAVGGYDDSNLIGRVLLLHWDGTEWSAVEGPSPGTRLSGLRGVDATSTSDIWAVGNYRSGPGGSTLVEHWDGIEWSHIPSPNPSYDSAFSGVDALSTNDVWAVGS
jgi:hypothetical protein